MQHVEAGLVGRKPGPLHSSFRRTAARRRCHPAPGSTGSPNARVGPTRGGLPRRKPRPRPDRTASPLRTRCRRHARPRLSLGLDHRRRAPFGRHGVAPHRVDFRHDGDVQIRSRPRPRRWLARSPAPPPPTINRSQENVSHSHLLCKSLQPLEREQSDRIDHAPTVRQAGRAGFHDTPVGQAPDGRRRMAEAVGRSPRSTPGRPIIGGSGSALRRRDDLGRGKQAFL